MYLLSLPSLMLEGSLRKEFKAPSVWDEPTQLALNCRMPVYLWLIS